MVVALAFSYVDAIPSWCQLSLSTALSVALMAKLGVIHPPAGAASLAFAGGSYGWSSVGSMLLANVVAIVMATFINNLQVERQYPMYWGVPAIDQEVKNIQKQSADLRNLRITRRQQPSTPNPS